VETDRINYITIQQYLDGKLDKEAMHELEKRALDDPFLADALDGYAHIKKPATKQLSLLQTQLEERIAQQQENKNVFNFSWQRLSIAAAAGLLFVSASILFWIKGEKAEDQIALNNKQVEVTLSPIDSLKAADSILEAVVSPDKKISVPERNKEVQIALQRKSLPDGAAKSEASDAPVSLNEVAVVGYGAQKKQSVVGSITTVNTQQAQGRLAEVSIEKNLSGKVISKSGEPLPGVSVRLNKSRATVTDVNGEFYLKDSVGGRLNIAYIGYDTKEIKIEPGVPLIVALDANTKSLNEVVVVGGYGTKVKELNEYSEPLIGWSKYKDYLQSSISSLKGEFGSGRVVVSFTVGSDNSLSNFQIEKGLDDKSNKEAIRLIKEGPAWIRGKQSEARVSVRFK
jgi:hypothetical protein